MKIVMTAEANSALLSILTVDQLRYGIDRSVVRRDGMIECDIPEWLFEELASRRFEGETISDLILRLIARMKGTLS